MWFSNLVFFIILDCVDQWVNSFAAAAAEVFRLDTWQHLV